MTMKTAAALVLLGALVLSACGNETASEKSVADGLDKWAAESDGDGSVAGEFKKDYPNRWSTMRSQLEVHYAEGAGVEGGGLKAAKTDAMNQISIFMKQHFGAMAKASDASLAALFDEQRALINNLWTIGNSETCAHVAGGGLMPGDDPGKYTSDTFADKRMHLKLMREGADHPATHKPFAWTPAEQAHIDAVFKHDNIKIPKEGMSGADFLVQCVGAADVGEVVKTFPADRKADFEADHIAKWAASAAAP
jgi:hypothetical protein